MTSYACPRYPEPEVWSGYSEGVNAGRILGVAVAAAAEITELHNGLVRSPGGLSNGGSQNEPEPIQTKTVTVTIGDPHVIFQTFTWHFR